MHLYFLYIHIVGRIKKSRKLYTNMLPVYLWMISILFIFPELFSVLYFIFTRNIMCCKRKKTQLWKTEVYQVTPRVPAAPVPGLRSQCTMTRRCLESHCQALPRGSAGSVFRASLSSWSHWFHLCREGYLPKGTSEPFYTWHNQVSTPEPVIPGVHTVLEWLYCCRSA